MTCALEARKRISSWRRRYSRMSKVSESPRRALGKGLSALLGPRPSSAEPVAPAELQPPTEELLQVPVDQIDPNPLQARTIFQTERLQELSQSIKVNGVIQPLVVLSLIHIS